MGYEIEALAGNESLLQEHTAVVRNAHVVALAQGIAIIPMTYDLFDEISAHATGKADTRLHGFEFLSPALATWAEEISRDGPIAYFEAGYFGGMGSQKAIVWKDGVVTAGPLHGDAIDQALRMLGVERTAHHDEFDSVGLGRERRTEAWAAKAIVGDLLNRAEEPIPALVEALHYECKSGSLQGRVRSHAARSLGQFGSAARAAIPALVQSLKADADSGVHASAAFALAAIGPEEVVVPALIGVLNHAVYEKRWLIVQALGELGPPAKEAVPALVKVLQDQVLHDFLGVRRGAAESLGKIGPEASAAVPALIEALKDEDWTVRSAAAEALGEIGPEGWDVASALNDARNDDNEWVREAAGRALAKVQGKGASTETDQGNI